MKTIKQRGEWDCGVACLAMLADVTYEEALKFMSERYPQVVKTRKVSSGKIVEGLRFFGREPRQDRCEAMRSSGFSKLSGDALVGVRPDRDAPTANHWVVWDADEQKIRDPYGYAEVVPIKALVV